MTARIVLERTALRPGEAVRGRVLRDRPWDRRAELSVLWETSGKGTTDLGVVHHVTLPEAAEHGFDVQLPLLPLTYVGTLIKVRWFVRVRTLVMLGDDLVTDAELEVGW